MFLKNVFFLSILLFLYLCVHIDQYYHCYAIILIQYYTMAYEVAWMMVIYVVFCLCMISGHIADISATQSLIKKR